MIRLSSTTAATTGLILALAACSSADHDTLAAPPDAAPYTDPPDGEIVTWDTWVSGFSNAYCVSCHSPTAPCGGSGCHTPDNPAINALQFDMREKSSWTARIATIQCGIATTQDPAWNCSVPTYTYPKMAPGYPLPTDHARGLIVDWIDAGTP